MLPSYSGGGEPLTMFVNDYDDGHEILDDNLRNIQKRFDSSKVKYFEYFVHFL